MPDIEGRVDDLAAEGTARFECLFRTHYRSVLAYARRRSSADPADDIVAETFVVAWRRLDEVPPDALPWLIAVARLTLSNHERSGRRQRALLIRATSRAPVEQHRPDFTGDRMVFEALARLPESEREALTLIVWEGLTPQQAANALGCSGVAVRARLHRARRRLAREFNRERHRPARAAVIGVREETL
jgi:RNA polymerase sigma-70 factor (ECF subfamily)